MGVNVLNLLSCEAPYADRPRDRPITGRADIWHFDAYQHRPF